MPKHWRRFDFAGIGVSCPNGEGHHNFHVLGEVDLVQIDDLIKQVPIFKVVHELNQIQHKIDDLKLSQPLPFVHQVMQLVGLGLRDNVQNIALEVRVVDGAHHAVVDALVNSHVLVHHVVYAVELQQRFG